MSESDPLEIHQTLVLCTSHISSADIEFLESEETSIVIYSLDGYGWLVYVGDIEHLTDKVMEIEKYSEAFRSAVRLARSNDCSYIRFDPDGPEIKQLPVSIW